MHAHNAFARSSSIEPRAAWILFAIADNLLSPSGFSEATAGASAS
jgi:hypothetical protein